MTLFTNPSVILPKKSQFSFKTFIMETITDQKGE